jgi:hypothetical protein
MSNSPIAQCTPRNDGFCALFLQLADCFIYFEDPSRSSIPAKRHWIQVLQ